MHMTIGQAAIPILLILLVMYRRIRRTVGFQPYRPGSLKVRIGIFSVISILLLYFGFLHPIIWAADAAGIGVGGILALFAIRHNQFEHRESGLYYRTHTGIQAAIVVLLVGRIAYRFIFDNPAMSAANAQAAADQQAQMQAFSKDPWTAGIFFIMAAYYLAYYIYLLREGKQQLSGNEGEPTGHP